MHINGLSLESLPLVARHLQHDVSRPSVVGDLIDLRALRRITEATHDTLLYRAARADRQASAESEREAVHLSRPQQRAMDRALGRSVRIIDCGETR